MSVACMYDLPGPTGAGPWMTTVVGVVGGGGGGMIGGAARTTGDVVSASRHATLTTEMANARTAIRRQQDFEDTKPRMMATHWIWSPPSACASRRSAEANDWTDLIFSFFSRAE